MERCPLPIIGGINGFAITGGFELALGCDVLIASTQGRFADTHARVGIMPGWGLSQKLSRAIGIYRAKELSLTGNYLTAEQAAAWGLVNRVVAPAELLPACHALAQDMRSCAPDVVRAYKRVIDAGFATTFSEGLRIGSHANRDHARTL
jgi:enoyl-CoA hydratase